MAQRYKERLLAGSGTSNKSYESELGLKLLQKMGWNKGNGLGKNQHGRTDCIQVEKREEGQGLGADKTGPQEFKWNNAWWNNNFDNVAKKINIQVNDNDSETEDESESESEEQQNKKVIVVKKISKKNKVKPAQKKLRKLSCVSCSSVDSVETNILKQKLQTEKKSKSSFKKSKKN